MEATVARHETPLGSWELAFGSPHETLRPHVARYCGYAERTAAPLRRREPASPYVTLIVSFGAAVEVLEDGAPPRRHVSFVAGPDDAWAVTEHAGEQAGVDVKLTPLAARAVLGVPAGELARQVVDLDAVLGRAGSRLTEQLAEAPDWPTRFTCWTRSWPAASRRPRRPSPPSRGPGTDSSRATAAFASTPSPRSFAAALASSGRGSARPSASARRSPRACCGSDVP